MSPPLPGSSEDQRARQRLRRRVGREVSLGRQLPAPDEARLAVEIADAHLGQLPRARRYAVGLITTAFVLAALHLLVLSDRTFGWVWLAIGTLQLLVAVPMFWRVMPSRLQRARELNAEVVARAQGE